MFLSHWFELSGVDKVMAPMPVKRSSSSSATENNIHGNNASAAAEKTNGNAVNEDPEHPIWSIVAPRQDTSINATNKENTHNGHDRVGGRVTKAPPAEAFQQQRLPYYYRDDNDSDDDDNETNQRLHQTIQEKEELQATYDTTVSEMKQMAKEKRELEEQMEKMRLELEVTKLNVCDGNNGWQPTTPATNGVTSTPAIATSVSQHMAASLSTQPATDEPPTMDEKAYIESLVIDAAGETARTLSAPSFKWEQRKNIFGRCSAPPKKTKKQSANSGKGGGVERSVNLKKIIKELKNNPTLVNIRSANMPPLPDGYSLLHAAVYAGNIEVVEYLLQEYVLVDPNGNDYDDRPIIDLNVRDLQGRTPLHICADLGHTELLLVLAQAYDDLEKILEKRVKDDESDDDEVGNLSNGMAKLDTKSNDASFTSPPPQARTRRVRKKTTRSPRPPPQLSPAFAGATAPIDLSGRTPLGYAATSPIPKAKNNRAQNEKILYKSGDRSIVGERTPPRERSGGLFSPPRHGKQVCFANKRDDVNGKGEQSDVGGGGGVTGLTSYLSPAPRKTAGRKATPFHSLSSPSPLKPVSEESIVNSVAWGAAEMPGKRIDMEDAILCQYPLEVPPRPLTIGGEEEEESHSSPVIVPTMGIFSVFDGHGDGGYASQFISSNLISKLQSSPNWAAAFHEINLSGDLCSSETLESIFTEACYELDDDLKNDKSKPRDGGTTAIVSVVSSCKIVVANVGDSRCILVKKKSPAESEQVGGEESKEEVPQIEVIPMSEDHKPDLPDERSRIESAGLEVHTDQVPPSEDDENGQYEMISKVKRSDREMLGVARAFGDYDYKSNGDLSASRQAVVCTPDILVRDRVDDSDMFLVLACDGVWDVMSNDEVGLFVAHEFNAATESLAKDDQPAEADILARVGDRLLTECLEKGSTDNMSVLIVALPGSGLSLLGNASVTVAARALAFE